MNVGLQQTWADNLETKLNVSIEGGVQVDVVFSDIGETKFGWETNDPSFIWQCLLQATPQRFFFLVKRVFSATSLTFQQCSNPTCFYHAASKVPLNFN